MTTLRDAARQALAFTMRDFATMRDFQAARAVVQDILIAALAQQAAPVAWMYEWGGRKHLTFTDQRWIEKTYSHFNKSTPLYTAPPQRKPLTEDDIAQMWSPDPGGVTRRPILGWHKVIDFARGIERAHGIGGDDEQA